MKPVFADTHFFIAFLSERDAGHQDAVRWYDEHAQAEIVTSSFILLELADGMSGVEDRELCADFLHDLMASSSIRVAEVNESLLWRGFDLYAKRRDKEWSLTDCTSFVVMADENIADALTGDRHFEQAGFCALFVRKA